MKSELIDLIKKIIIYVPSKLIPAFISLASASIFTRVFSTEEYGKYSLALSIAALVIAVLSQWLHQSIHRYLPGMKREEEKIFFKQSAVFGLIMNLSILIILNMLLFPIINHALSVDIKKLYLFCMVYIFTQLIIIFNGMILQAEMKAKQYTKYTVINTSIRFFIVILLIYLFKKDIAFLFLATVISNLILIPFLMKVTSTNHRYNFSNRTVRRQCFTKVKEFLQYGIPISGWFIASLILNVGDRYVIQFFHGSGQVGIYSANYNFISGSIMLVTTPIILATHPFLIRAWNTSNEKNVAKWLSIIAQLLFILGLLLVSMVWLFSKDMAIIFLGKSFREGYVVMPIIIAGMIIWNLGMYAHKPFEFMEKTKELFLVAMVSALLNIVLNVIFVPVYGYVGAAYTTLISYAFYTVLVGVLGRRILNWKLGWKKLIPYIGFIIVTTYIIGTCRVNILTSFDSYYIQLISSIIGYLIMLMIVLLMIFISNKELFLGKGDENK